VTQALGFHAAAAVLAGDAARARVLYLQKGRHDKRLAELMALAEAAGVRVEWVDKRWLERRAEGQHQGVLLECHAVGLRSEAEFELLFPDLPPDALLLALDGITDPRNLGACLRSAAAAGVSAVLLPKRRAAPINALAERTAAGGAEALCLVEVVNLVRRLRWLQERGFWVVGTAEDAPLPWHRADLCGPRVLVVGSEGDGLRALTRSVCDTMVSIPMQGPVASLNVAVATGVLLFERVRQASTVGASS
jgi:23S rRNA (guanosine2251-2'-O)-methyltransferase